MKKTALLKFAAIIVICVLLDITLHMVTGPYSTMPEAPDYNKLAELLGTEVTATLWALLAFSSVACVFYRFQHGIPGAGFKKGLRYGGAIALLWLVAMLEGVSLFGNPVINEFVVGLSDAIPVLLMSILSGLFIVEKVENKNTEAASFSFYQKLPAICLFSGIFTLGRYAAYFSGIIQSGYQTNPVFTFIWTLLMGACIGVVYVLLGQTGKTLSLTRRAVTFGVLIFGVNWAVFLVFMPFLFSGFLIDVLSRIAIDVLLVTLGCYLSLKFNIKRFQEVKYTRFKEGYRIIDTK
ncbi:MAG: hypothetical protein PHU23_01850 [Dehalococcoidales bacterium]|nr:hypothetical protein [Dehalococcoidales bacterium]